jgi:hypothetical protein
MITHSAPGEGQDRAVRELVDVVRLGERHAPEELLADGEREALGRIGEQVTIVGMDVSRDILRTADRRDRPHVVYVTVREQHRDRLQPVPGEEFLDPGLRVLSWVDDHALLAGRRRHQIAIGGEGTGGKSCDEHEHRLPTWSGRQRTGKRTRPAGTAE